MERTSRNQWRETPYRQAQAYQRGSGGVLQMARRQKERQPNPAALVGIVLVLFACIAAFSGVSKALAKRHSASGGRQAAQTSAQPGAAPALSYQGDGRPVTILLLGSDQRGDDRSFRTDVIVLVTIDPANTTASAVSFPRDLWVEPPALDPMKINMVYALGGFDALAGTFKDNFGVRPDYYVMTNFSGFTHLIDSMGGIDVNIGQPLTDSCDLPQAQGGICHVDAGVLPMDGATALWYARSRNSSSDYDRLRRAQEVVQAVFERLMNLNALAQMPKYYQEFSQHIETNLSVFDITPLVPVAVRLFQEPERIQRHVIDENQATPSWSWDGMWILLPDPGAIQSLLAEAGILR